MNFSNYLGKFIDVQVLTPNVSLFRVQLDNDIDFKAGQFMNFEFLGKDAEGKEKKFMRAYSIASCPVKGSRVLEFCVKNLEGGCATPYLFDKQIGDEINLKGPFGMFNLDKFEKSDKSKVVFIGTGTGISPLRAMVQHLLVLKKEIEITLIFGVKLESDCLFKASFEKLEEENPNFIFRWVVSRPLEDYSGRIGYVQDNLDGLDIINSNFFICGSKVMVEDVKKKLEDFGVLKDDIFFECY